MSTEKQYGFRAGIAGHSLTEDTATKLYGTYHKFGCSCNELVFTGRLKQDGRADSRCQREWTEHLHIHELDPTTIYAIGKLTKAVVSHEVFVFPMTYVGFDEYAKNARGWTARVVASSCSYRGQLPWVMGMTKRTKRTKKKVLFSLFHTEAEAIAGAKAYLSKNDVGGWSVEYADDSTWAPQQVELNAQSSFMVLLTDTEEALASKDLMKVEHALEESEKLLGLVPIITRRRDMLKSHREGLLTRKLL